MDESRRRLRAALAGVLLVTAIPLLAQEPPKEQAQIEAMLAADQPEAAYSALRQWPQYAGQLWYDSLLGRAAVKSGRYPEGIEILRRVLELHPDHDPSRFFLALAYARTDQTDAAREQYAWLADNAATPAGRAQAKDAINVLAGGEHSSGMPPTAPDVVAAMERNQRREHPWSAQTFLAAGYDSNASAASQDDRFLVFQLGQNATSETSFISLGGSFVHRSYDADPWHWRNTISGGHRVNPSAHDFDTDVVNGQTELSWKNDHMLFASGLVYGRTLLDGSFNNDTLGWINRAEHLTERALYGIGLQLASVRYDQAFSTQDVDALLLDVSAATPPDSDSHWKLSLSPFVGVESPRESGSPFGRRLGGLRGSVAYLWSEALNVTLSGGAMLSRFDDDPSGGESRKDQRYNGGVGLTWHPPAFARWAVSSGVSYVRNQSNAVGFDYNRVLASVELTRSWGAE